MEAALVARTRGHDVTLYEKGEKLGGQLLVADYSEMKWALRNYRDYLIHQMDKLNVDVHLGEALTPEMVEEGGYDAVIAAIGSRPKMPGIPGIDDPRVCNVFGVYGHEEELGEHVVIVGGGTTAMETGYHLAEEFGIDVTILECDAVLARDTPPVHCRAVMEKIWDACEKLTAHTKALVKGITEEGVVYTDEEGVEHVVPADTIVIATGMEPLMDQAMAFHGHGAQLITVGDSQKPGNVLSLTRSAWFATMQL